MPVQEPAAGRREEPPVIRARLAVAVLRTVRAAKSARSEGRPLGERAILRLYLRNRAELDPEGSVSADEPGAALALRLARSTGLGTARV